jgi:DNA-binding winged helix-turn-helix (wHTH) protein
MQDHESPRALLFPQGARSVVCFGPFRLELADGLLTRNGDEVRLPPRATIILQQLVASAGRIVSKQSLMDAAWKDGHVSETSLTEAIGLVRQALGDDPQKPEFIQTVHRRGYRFIAPIATEAPFAVPPAVPTRIDQAVARNAAASDPTRRPVAAGLVAVTALMTVAGLWAWTARRRAPPEQVIRAIIDLPAEQAPIPGSNAHPIVALSPDGQRFVYVGGAPARLFLRELSRLEAVPVPGTEGAHGPFFSPAGDWVAFFAQGSLKKVRVTGSDRPSPEVLCATERGVGGAWMSASEIVFAPNWEGPLMRVNAAGGRPQALPLAGGAGYRWPDRLDDETVLATRWRSSAGDAAVVAISLSSGAERVIAEPATFGRSAAQGHVLFLRDGDLFAVPVDPSLRRPQGTPVRVAPAVMTGTTGAAQFAVSPRGPLLYMEDVPERTDRTIARVDGRGVAADLSIPPRDFRHVAVCGNRLAAIVFARGRTDLWAGYLDRAALTQLTREGAAAEPVWSPDCRTITFSWNRSGVASIYTTAADAAEPPRVLFESPVSSAPGSWSADGRWLAYTERHPETSSDIWLWDRTTGHPSSGHRDPGNGPAAGALPGREARRVRDQRRREVRGRSHAHRHRGEDPGVGRRRHLAVLVRRRAPAVLPSRHQHHAHGSRVARRPGGHQRSGPALHASRHRPVQARLG